MGRRSCAASLASGLLGQGPAGSGAGGRFSFMGVVQSLLDGSPQGGSQARASTTTAIAATTSPGATASRTPFAALAAAAVATSSKAAPGAVGGEEAKPPRRRDSVSDLRAAARNRMLTGVN